MEIVVVLHNIRSLYNVASIFRTADGAGVKKIYLCGITPTPRDRFGKIREQFAKVALGAERYVEWEQATSTAKLISRLKNPRAGEGYKILAVEQAKKAVPYYKFQPLGASRRRGKNERKFALVFGNEVRGLPPAVLKLADKILEIPMRRAMVRQAHHPRHLGRGKESLNVSVAAGIVLYNLIRYARRK